MRPLIATLLTVALSSCAKSPPAEETEAIERYRFMYGSVAADFCITSLHLLTLNRRNVDRGTFEPRDRTVVVDNRAALERLRTDAESSLKTMYADQTRRARDAAFIPFITLTIDCHTDFLKYADQRSPEHLDTYLACQKRFSTMVERMTPR